ncbi:hypothetical protein [Frankia sp. QA3]|uniref:hypothetical protein n=1 Tax=Frankia sp. QA3 TaxID=710111 RepID=UPI000269BCD4|nr:hypothetical protein [Frankia sp. QA3]EIV92257.1 hypothetical protein FraQA3DRAFT_1790 [Frankia sp. QA3]
MNERSVISVDFNDLGPDLTLSALPEDFPGGVPVAGTRIRVEDEDGNSADTVVLGTLVQLQVDISTFTDGRHDD